MEIIFAEAFFRKWKKSWIVVCSGGPVRVFKNKKASRPQKSYDLKMDCIVIKTGRQVCLAVTSIVFRSKSITSLNNTLVYLCIHHDQRGSVWWTNDVVNDWVLECCMFVCVCGGGGGIRLIIRGGFQRSGPFFNLSPSRCSVNIFSPQRG